MGRYAVKQVPPDVAKGVRDVVDGVKKLDHPFYKVEERKGTGKATCRQCDKPIKEGERSIYFHYAPEDDNTWIRQRGSIHAEDCGGGANMYTKCPACKDQIPRSEWTDHWTGERKKRRQRAAQVANPLNALQKAKGVNPEMGLDPTTQPGNQTSMGDGSSDAQGSDAQSQDPLKDVEMKEVDQQARKLQRGMKGFSSTHVVLVHSFKQVHKR